MNTYVVDYYSQRCKILSLTSYIVAYGLCKKVYLALSIKVATKYVAFMILWQINSIYMCMTLNNAHFMIINENFQQLLMEAC